MTFFFSFPFVAAIRPCSLYYDNTIPLRRWKGFSRGACCHGYKGWVGDYAVNFWYLRGAIFGDRDLI